MNDFIQRLENKRRKYDKRYKLYVAAIILFLIIFVYVRMVIKLNTPDGTLWYLFAFIFAIVAMCFYAMAHLEKNKYKENIKDELIPMIIASVFEDCTYQKYGLININEVHESRFYNEFERFRSKNLLMGAYQDINFEAFDLELINIHYRMNRNNEKVEDEKIFFKGRYYIFHLNYANPTVVKLIQDKKRFSQHLLTQVKTNSEDLNQKFQVWTTNENHFLEVLTNTRVQAILNLENEHKGKMNISFEQNKVYIAVNDRKEYLHLKLNQKVDPKYLKAFYDEFEIIKTIINEIILGSR